MAVSYSVRMLQGIISRSGITSGLILLVARRLVADCFSSVANYTVQLRTVAVMEAESYLNSTLPLMCTQKKLIVMIPAAPPQPVL